MVFAFLYHKNINIGNSILDKESLQYIDEIYTLADKHNTNIILPVDFKCNDDFSNTGNIINVDVDNGIPDTHMGLDIGKKTIRLFNIALYSSDCIIWNGPLGVTEFSNFATGSYNIMKFISVIDAKTIIGGGDTASACEQFNLQNEMTHVSTGGGASLEVLEGKVLKYCFCKTKFLSIIYLMSKFIPHYDSITYECCNKYSINFIYSLRALRCWSKKKFFCC